jgi:23S rRNA pseudouridine1911/1915/1917 synthase
VRRALPPTRSGSSAARNVEARANLQVREGDQVNVNAPEAAPSAVTAEALPLDILYQDADLAVLNKPAGMVIHPGAGHGSGTLVNALAPPSHRSQRASAAS